MHREYGAFPSFPLFVSCKAGIKLWHGKSNMTDDNDVGYCREMDIHTVVNSCSQQTSSAAVTMVSINGRYIESNRHHSRKWGK